MTELPKEDFVTLEDGFVYFWASRVAGAMTSRELRDIADELDKRNEKWKKQIDEYFENLKDDSAHEAKP
jgi:hypothetical protein